MHRRSGDQRVTAIVSGCEIESSAVLRNLLLRGPSLGRLRPWIWQHESTDSLTLKIPTSATIAPLVPSGYQSDAPLVEAIVSCG